MTDLDQRMLLLAESMEVPAADPEADLARGRRRVRRQRLAAGGAALATVAVLGTAYAVTAGGAGGGDGGREITPSPGAPATAGPSGRVVQPSEAPQPTPSPDEGAPAVTADRERLAEWNEVLAEHLDPERRHLAPQTDANWNVQSSDAPGGGGSLGSRYSWTNPGETGLGYLGLTVSTMGIDQQDSPCVLGQLECAERSAGGFRRVLAGQDGEVVTVTAERSDRMVLSLTFDPLYANNSVEPVSGSDLTVDALLAALRDPRLKLPGAPRMRPEPIDDQTWTQRGIDLLSGPRDTMEVQYAGTGVGPVFTEVAWVGEESSGTVMWDAEVAGSGRPACYNVQFTDCRSYPVGDQEVLVGQVRDKWGGGWQAIYRGRLRETRVVFTPTGPGDSFPVRRTFGFLTDPAWQEPSG